MEILLVRHGNCNYDHPVFEGDLPLSPKGEEQARLVARRLKKLEPTHLFASHLKRALATAESISNETGLEPQVIKAFREVWIGEMLGMTNKEARRKYGKAYPGWKEPFYDFGYSGGETTEKFVSRVVDAFERHILKPFDGSDAKIVLVSHGGPINVVLHHVLGVPFDGHLRFDIHNTGISRLRQGKNRRLYLVGVNDTRHLADGQITLV